jgi:adenylylsulfate kinase
VKADHETPQ